MAAQKKDQPIASHHIAEKRGIPERFLLKVLKPLVSAQVLRSIKGPNGGYRLARQSADISLLDIVEAVDGPIRGLIPLMDNDSTNAVNKKLEQICAQVSDQVRKSLAKVKINELAKE